jgi:hypothetical protein
MALLKTGQQGIRQFYRSRIVEVKPCVKPGALAIVLRET